jgi:hypothetical protein
MKIEKETSPWFSSLLSNKENWPILEAMYNAAAQVVGEYDVHGEVLQVSTEENRHDAGAEYGRESSIERLKGSLILIDPDVFSSDCYPHLSDEQCDKIREVAIETEMAGNGDQTLSQSDAESNLEGLSIHEILVRMGWGEDSGERTASLNSRFGFNPFTGRNLE